MKVLQYSSYGSVDVLRWDEKEIPEPNDKQVLVKVIAASINPSDSKKRMGLFQTGGADKFPKRMGMDFAGIISKTGKDVKQFKEGDKVMGYKGMIGGSFADYVIADELKVFHKPGNLTFEEATALPLNAATALKVAEEYLKPSEGKSILVIGASGGIGLFVVQICINSGAEVTGITSGKENIEILQSFGLKQIIDFENENILQMGKKFDAILDTSGKMKFTDAVKILNENGEFNAMVPEGESGKVDGNKKENQIFAVPGPDEFNAVQKMAEDGKLKPFVGKTFPMYDAIEVIKKFEKGEFNYTGKIVLVNEI